MSEQVLWPCLCLLIGLGLLIFGICARKMLRGSKLWPKTHGTIIESKTESEWRKMGGSFQRTYIVRPKVVYEYHVAGEKFTSSQLALVEINSANEDLARSKAKKYKPGQEVVVYYDPRKPNFATLQVGDPTRGKFPLGANIVGSLAAIAGIVWLWILVR